jgi:phospholipase/carboxylesterase
MNRLSTKTLLPEPQLLTNRLGPAVAGETMLADSEDSLVFAPLHYESNYAYPLLVWLHPEGESEQQLKQIMPRISMRNYVAVAPRGTMAVPACGEEDATPGYTWSQSEDHIHLAEQRVLSAIERAQEFHVHPGRIFLAGAGCGGTMALRLTLSLPSRFRGAATLGGPFPAGHNPLACLNQTRHLQILIASARDSRTYAPSTVCRDLRLLHCAGIDVVLRQYPHRDALDRVAPADVDRWIMETISNDRETSVVSA